MFISFLYVFWATMCPSSLETRVFFAHKYNCFSWLHFYFFSLHVLGDLVPIIRRKACIYAHKYSCFSWLHFISFLYMFWATWCPSSGETPVFMRINTVVSTDYTFISFLYMFWTNIPIIRRNACIYAHKYSCFYWLHFYFFSLHVLSEYAHHQEKQRYLCA
jgi:hypothetical protein